MDSSSERQPSLSLWRTVDFISGTISVESTKSGELVGMVAWDGVEPPTRGFSDQAENQPKKNDDAK